MFEWFKKLIDNFFKEKETAAELNNIRRSHNIKYEDVTK
tara:strand:- start:121 stop:237 length:117 start_codon:yes stop_codon:yes gene_type:complete